MYAIWKKLYELVSERRAFEVSYGASTSAPLISWRAPTGAYALKITNSKFGRIAGGETSAINRIGAFGFSWTTL